MPRISVVYFLSIFRLLHAKVRQFLIAVGVSLQLAAVPSFVAAMLILVIFSFPIPSVGAMPMLAVSAVIAVPIAFFPILFVLLQLLLVPF